MKKFLLINIILISTIGNVSAETSSVAPNSTHEVLLGEMSDNSPYAAKYQPKPKPVPEFIKEQAQISNTYNQKQIEIEEEEDYYSGMGFGMYGYPMIY